MARRLRPHADAAVAIFAGLVRRSGAGGGGGAWQAMTDVENRLGRIDIAHRPGPVRGASTTGACYGVGAEAGDARGLPLSTT